MSRSRLWRNPDYLKFWSGETVSQFGSQITTLALPLTAVLTLHAGAAEMGVLNALSYLPFLVLTLFVGVWVDRVRRRPVLLASSVARALLIGLIPVLAWSDGLTIGLLWLLALLIGVFTVMFEVTYQAYLPSLVEREDLVEGNSKLQASASTAQVGGPAVGGWLVAWFSAPTALLVDAVSFLVSAASLAAIRKPEPQPEREPGRPDVRRDIAAGLRFTFGHRVLRACVLEAGSYNFFWMGLQTVFLLYATREVGLSAGALGLVLGGGAVGALAGALVSQRISDRLGVGRTVVASIVVGCAAPLLVPLAGGPRWLVFALFVVSFLVGSWGSMVCNIHVVSLRQLITPSTMLGRMNASYRAIAWGTVPLGALLGGGLGSLIGLRPTLFLTATGILLSALWIVFSPVAELVEMPTQVDAVDGPAPVPPPDPAEAGQPPGVAVTATGGGHADAPGTAKESAQ